MNIKAVVIKSGDYSHVINRTYNTREWEEYTENAAAIAGALHRLGCACLVMQDGIFLTENLHKRRPDIAWICSGGIQGHDPATHLPGFLEMLGIKYVGSRPMASGMADNKAATKVVATRAGIPTPEYYLICADVALADVMHGLPAYPLIVKPVCGLCACGVYRVDNVGELKSRIYQLRERYKNDVLIEEYVDGVDVAVSILDRPHGPYAFPVMPRYFQSASLPDDKTHRLQHSMATLREGEPTRALLSDSVYCKVIQYSEVMFRSLGLRHFARVDFRIRGEEVFLLEVTHKPDMTPGGVFARSAALDGVPYDDLISRILTKALI